MMFARGAELSEMNPLSHAYKYYHNEGPFPQKKV